MLKIKTLRMLSLGALLLAFGCNHSTSQQSRLPTAPTAVEQTPPNPAVAPQLSGPEVVALVASRYPERLAGGVSAEQRVANMEFLRDRIIEVGTCNGLLLAWNRKSNGGRSIDAIDWRHGAEDVNDVVDLASAYDDGDRPLNLHWVIVGGPAGWDPYPAQRCPSNQ